MSDIVPDKDGQFVYTNLYYKLKEGDVLHYFTRVLTIDQHSYTKFKQSYTFTREDFLNATKNPYVIENFNATEKPSTEYPYVTNNFDLPEISGVNFDLSDLNTDKIGNFNVDIGVTEKVVPLRIANN